MKRFICWLIGCEYTGYPLCDRCGMDYYEKPFRGILASVKWIIVDRWPIRRCLQCDKIFFSFDPVKNHCSWRCRDEWLPF